jgi:hypothetical protein
MEVAGVVVKELATAAVKELAAAAAKTIANTHVNHSVLVHNAVAGNHRTLHLTCAQAR